MDYDGSDRVMEKGVGNLELAGCGEREMDNQRIEKERLRLDGRYIPAKVVLDAKLAGSRELEPELHEQLQLVENERLQPELPRSDSIRTLQHHEELAREAEFSRFCVSQTQEIDFLSEYSG